MAISYGAPLKIQEKINIMIMSAGGEPLSYFKFEFPNMFLRLIWIWSLMSS